MIRWIKIPVFLVCLAPLGLLAWQGLHRNLGANPIEVITHSTGDWTMRFLLITLSITPLRKLLGVPSLIRFRRMFGLYAFFYASLHFMLSNLPAHEKISHQLIRNAALNQPNRFEPSTHGVGGSKNT